MDEIEKLEAEIAEKKKLLSKLKLEKRRGEQLDFKLLLHGLSDVNTSVDIRVQAIDKMRRFVVMWARAEKEVRNGKMRLIIDGKRNKVADLSREEIEICNDFIVELIPIVKKHVLLLNELEGRNA